MIRGLPVVLVFVFVIFVSCAVLLPPLYVRLLCMVLGLSLVGTVYFVNRFHPRAPR